MAVVDAMWVERYRPQELSDIVDQKEIVGSIKALLKKESEMPHMLFSGSAGIGKTTTALCIARQVLGGNWREYTLELNASDERGIGMVREKVKKFTYWAGFSEIPFKIIILDEADEMTADAQTALRRIIEDAARYCRFIIIANNISKIIEPIQSRCAVFKFTTIPQEAALLHLKEIARKEGVKTTDGGLQVVYDYSGGDLRHAINLLQAVSSMGEVTAERARASAGLTKAEDVAIVLKLAVSGAFTEAREKMIELIKVYGISESDFLKYFNAAVFKRQPSRMGEMLAAIAKYDYRLLVGANPEIQLSALLAEMAEIAKR